MPSLMVDRRPGGPCGLQGSTVLLAHRVYEPKHHDARRAVRGPGLGLSALGEYEQSKRCSDVTLLSEKLRLRGRCGQRRRPLAQMPGRAGASCGGRLAPNPTNDSAGPTRGYRLRASVECATNKRSTKEKGLSVRNNIRNEGVKHG